MARAFREGMPRAGGQMIDVLGALVQEVLDPGTLEPVGGGTRLHVVPATADRKIRAPGGVVSVEPADMIVRVRVGTTLGELAEVLAQHGQRTVLDGPDPTRSTVGGALAVGQSSLRRLGDGPVRDAVLGLTWVSADGNLVRAGGATVKNVSGFDLCRVMVGSQGTLGVLAEAILRTRPRPATSRWLTGPADPFELRGALHAPATILWDGDVTWVLLEGHPRDVDDEAQIAARRGCPTEAVGPPDLPLGGRLSLSPRELRSLESGDHGGFVAEVGVGIVHTTDRVPTPPIDPTVAAVGERIKGQLDPTGRLAPGRRLW